MPRRHVAYDREQILDDLRTIPAEHREEARRLLKEVVQGVPADDEERVRRRSWGGPGQDPVSDIGAHKIPFGPKRGQYHPYVVLLAPTPGKGPDIFDREAWHLLAVGKATSTGAYGRANQRAAALLTEAARAAREASSHGPNTVAVNPQAGPAGEAVRRPSPASQRQRGRGRSK